MCLSPRAKSAQWDGSASDLLKVNGDSLCILSPVTSHVEVVVKAARRFLHAVQCHSWHQTLQWAVSSCSCRPFPLVRRALSTRLSAAAPCVVKLLKCRKNTISPFTATAFVRISRVESGGTVSVRRALPAFSCIFLPTTWHTSEISSLSASLVCHPCQRPHVHTIGRRLHCNALKRNDLVRVHHQCQVAQETPEEERR